MAGRQPVHGDWPFVGREGELASLQRMLLDRTCPGVIVAADSGVGKTRMANECLAIAHRAGFATARATATASQQDIPLAAFAHLLPQQAGEPPAHDRNERLRRAESALLASAEGKRLVLLVDDGHLLDSSSATLLYRLIVANAAFVLVTLRAGERAPEVLLTAWKDEFVDRLDLPGLTDEALAGLLEAVLGDVDPNAISNLVTRSERNVLFLRELVLGALRDGALVLEDGMWRLKDPVQPSARLIELIEARLGGLSALDRMIVDIVAVGEPLRFDQLAAVADPTLAEALERRGILECRIISGRVEIRLCHPLFGDVVRARLPVLRIRSIARALAEQAEAEPAPTRDELVRIGQLRLVAGDGAPNTLLEAAIAARWNYAFGLAPRLAQAAIDAGAGHDARLLAAQLRGLQGHWKEADQELQLLWSTVSEDGQRARVAVARLDNFLYAGQSEASLLVAEEAAKVIVSQQWRDEIQARRAPILVMTEGPRATWSAVAELVERTSGAAFVWACLTGARSACRAGRSDAAIDLSERGMAAQLELDEPIAWYPWFHLLNRCEALAHAGRLAEAHALAADQHREAIVEHSPEAQATFASELSHIAYLRGRVRLAERLAREATAIFRDLGRPMFLQESQHRLAMALSAAGRTESAAVLTEIDASDSPSAMYNVVDLTVARAWAAAANGHPRQAQGLLREGVAIGDDIGDLVGVVGALHDIARLGRAGDVLDEIVGLTSLMDGQLVQARSAHVDGLARRDPVRLAEAATAFEALGADLFAAEAASDAAAAWRQHGEVRRAQGSARHAQLLARRCEGAATPALRSLDSRGLLTAAEREAAELAATGLSNRKIAEELSLSVRSIENRLQHVYQKLGIVRREDLRNALGVPDGSSPRLE